MKNMNALPLLTLVLLMTACGGGSDKKNEVIVPPVVTPPAVVEKPVVQGEIFGSFSTGTTAEPAFVYFDLETQSVVELSTEEAANNSVWDIALKRTGVYLNIHADNSVSAFDTGNNASFIGDDGKAIADSFINASAETELEGYLAITTADIPEDAVVFIKDVSSEILTGFYNYDHTTHVVSAATDNYFVVNSDQAFTKFRAKTLVTAGRTLSSITLGLAHQSSTDSEFSAEIDLTIDAALVCSSDEDVYVDFAMQQLVTSADSWDLHLPCTVDGDNKGGSFALNIAEDALAFQDFTNNYAAIDPSAVAYYGFKKNQYMVKAFDDTPWYQYGVNGGHLLWSQFNVYLIKTATSVHKFQITSYYNEEGTSGHYSFRADEVIPAQ
jgi:hypothetical protein